VRSVSDCAIIGQVYTPPNLRGRGYSTACVWHLTRKLLNDGFKHCALYADRANPYSNRVYQKIGYKETSWFDQYKIIS
jgi:predicted GNAT family acetyltransferase